MNMRAGRGVWAGLDGMKNRQSSVFDSFYARLYNVPYLLFFIDKIGQQQDNGKNLLPTVVLDAFSSWLREQLGIRLFVLSYPDAGPRNVLAGRLLATFGNHNGAGIDPRRPSKCADPSTAPRGSNPILSRKSDMQLWPRHLGRSNPMHR